jgi:hypothetical protein
MMQENGTTRKAFLQRHPRASLLALLSIVFLLGALTGATIRGAGGRSSISPRPRKSGEQPLATPWWRTRFPPASVDRPIPITDVKFDHANVLPDVACGSLDGAMLKPGAGAFVWGWAYDPRTKSPAVAVILLDNGRQLSPPIPVYRERPDVASTLHEPALMTSGWNVWLPAASLGDSREHVFEAFAVLADRKLGLVGRKIGAP